MDAPAREHVESASQARLPFELPEKIGLIRGLWQQSSKTRPTANVLLMLERLASLPTGSIRVADLADLCFVNERTMQRTIDDARRAGLVTVERPDVAGAPLVYFPQWDAAAAMLRKSHQPGGDKLSPRGDKLSPSDKVATYTKREIYLTQSQTHSPNGDQVCDTFGFERKSDRLSPGDRLSPTAGIRGQGSGARDEDPSPNLSRGVPGRGARIAEGIVRHPGETKADGAKFQGSGREPGSGVETVGGSLAGVLERLIDGGPEHVEREFSQRLHWLQSQLDALSDRRGEDRCGLPPLLIVTELVHDGRLPAEELRHLVHAVFDANGKGRITSTAAAYFVAAAKRRCWQLGIRDVVWRRSST